MRVEKRDGGAERRLLIGMATNRRFLAQVASHWPAQGGLFASPWSNLIGGWCVEHFRKYGEPPHHHLGPIVEAWAQGDEERDEEVKKTIGSFLTYLSSEYVREREELNPDYLTDLAAKLFRRVRVGETLREAQVDYDSGNVERAEQRFKEHSSLDLGPGVIKDLLPNLRGTMAETEADTVIRYPGALGEFFGDVFERGGFVSLFGPTGRGKTYWLLDIAWQAMLQRRRVLFLEVGDMNEKQFKKRLAARVTLHPFRSTNADHSWPCALKIPVAVTPGKWSEGAPPTVETKTKEFTDSLTDALIDQACERLVQTRLRSRESFFKYLVCHSWTLNVNGIDTFLQQLQDRDWPPDVVVCDYADLLAPLPGRVDNLRDKINQTWANLRRISEAHSCLLVTATQSDSPSYNKRLLGLDNFSEDRRKNDHPTAVIGINQTEDEKKLGVVRLNYTKLREGESIVSRVVHVAGSLAIASPALCSAF